jgi:hypothetical protein
MVNTIPIAKNRASVFYLYIKPINGCNKEAVSWYTKVINPIWVKFKLKFSLRIGYAAGITDCIKSFIKWAKAMKTKPNKEFLS